MWLKEEFELLGFQGVFIRNPAEFAKTKEGELVAEKVAALILAAFANVERDEAIQFAFADPHECNSVWMLMDARGQSVCLIASLVFEIEFEGQTLRVIHDNVVGTHPEFGGRGIYQALNQFHLKNQEVDVQCLSTQHPAVYKTLWRDESFRTIPFEGWTPSQKAIALATLLIKHVAVNGQAPDRNLVRRGYTHSIHEALPFERYPFFRDELGLGSEDGVFVLNVKARLSV